MNEKFEIKNTSEIVQSKLKEGVVCGIDKSEDPFIQYEYFLENDQELGVIQVVRSSENKESYLIGSELSDYESLKHKGYGTHMYVFTALKEAELERILTSDTMLSDEAEDLWKRLVEIGLANVVKKPKEENEKHDYISGVYQFISLKNIAEKIKDKLKAIE